MKNNTEQILKIVALILILIVMFIVISIFKSDNKNYNLLEYSDNLNIKEVITTLTISEDREVYYVLEGIIQKFMISSSDAISESYDYDADMVEDYYSVLTSEYKKYLKKDEYLKLVSNFLDKFTTVSKSSIEELHYLETKNIIKNIYCLNEESYICELVYDEKYSYIGIVLDEKTFTYNIFYIQ